jgi:hypothetical protein
MTNKTKPLQSIRARIFLVLSSQPLKEWGISEIKTVLAAEGYNPSSVKPAIMKMYNENLVTIASGGGRGNPYLFKPVHGAPVPIDDKGYKPRANRKTKHITKVSKMARKVKAEVAKTNKTIREGKAPVLTPIIKSVPIDKKVHSQIIGILADGVVSVKDINPNVPYLLYHGKIMPLAEVKEILKQWEVLTEALKGL